MVAAITKIKEAEDSSEAVVRKAGETAQEIIKAATAEGNAKKTAILNEAQARRAEILQTAKKEAEMECVPLDEQAERDIDRILHPDEAPLNAVIDVLVNHIAKAGL